MHKLLRALGIIAWISCILTLIYQALTWVFTASWPSLTMMDVSSDLFGIDLAALIQNLPIEYAVKMTYLLVTTELSLGLWWTGVAFFVAAVISKVVFGK